MSTDAFPVEVRFDQPKPPLQERALDIEEVVRLVTRAGAVVLRGLSLSAPEFEAFTRAFCGRFYISGVRHKGQMAKSGSHDGYTTRLRGSEFGILSHSEAAYLQEQPEVCFFHCEVPTQLPGGETCLVDGLAFYRQISAGLRKRLYRHGIIYHMLWERPRWQAQYGTESEIKVAQFLDQYPQMSYQFTREGLRLSVKSPAIQKSEGGRLIFLNGILSHLPEVKHPNYAPGSVYCNANNWLTYGNGTCLSNADISELIDIHDRILVPHRWQKNDVLIIDNRQVLHGRICPSPNDDRVLLSRFGWFHEKFRSFPVGTH